MNPYQVHSGTINGWKCGRCNQSRDSLESALRCCEETPKADVFVPFCQVVNNDTPKVVACSTASTTNSGDYKPERKPDQKQFYLGVPRRKGRK